MTTPKNGRPPVTGGDWMREVEKRIGREERRPQAPSAATLLGPGIAARAVALADWNSAAARFNGIWDADDADNAPESGRFLGFTIGTSGGHGVQLAIEHSPANTAPPLWARHMHFHAGQIPSYSDWFLLAPGSPQTGLISLWPAGVPVPETHLICDGSAYVSSLYPDLAALLNPGGNHFNAPSVSAPTGSRAIIHL